jgi:hypothetical protein
MEAIIEETFKDVEFDFFDENKLIQSVIGNRVPKKNIRHIIKEFFRIQCIFIMTFLSDKLDKETNDKLLESANQMIQEQIIPVQVEPALKELVNSLVLDEIKNKKNFGLMSMIIQLTRHYAEKFEEYF